MSVVVPMLDELGYIEECLDGFARQTYPLDSLEVLVVDGGSTDGSRQLVESMAVERPWLRILDNPARRASAAFNRGVESARGDVVCLFSSHGVPDTDYVERSVAVLLETAAAGVGGCYRHEAREPVAQALGLAMVSPFGMASPHRFARARREVDTISHPAYRRDALTDVGPFDESLERNSDYEMNWRLRERGYRLVFDPTIGSVYRPRGSLSKLGRQFWWYGRWKVRVLRRHPASVRARHLVPPVATAGMAAGPLLLASRRGRSVVATGAAVYGGVLAAALVHSRPRRRRADPFAFAAAFPVMHVAWGAGFLMSVAELLVRKRRG
ncbi:MAG: glycosyltransferase family 2 protein [Actinomycetota bacterium]|nr:glycosyltransferase family 2 protein [Actinomycetota bacterium]